MKVTLWILSSVLVLSLGHSPAHAAGGSTSAGDGGHVITCRDQAGNEQTQLLDVFEGKLAYGVQNDLTRANLAQRLQDAGVSREDTTYFIESFDALNKTIVFESSLPFIEPGGRFNGRVYDDCRIQQVALRFKDTKDNLLRIDPDLYRHLNERERFVLLVHERLHSFQSGGSEVARAAVIFLGADSDFRSRNRLAFHKMMKTGIVAEMK